MKANEEANGAGREGQKKEKKEEGRLAKKKYGTA